MNQITMQNIDDHLLALLRASSDYTAFNNALTPNAIFIVRKWLCSVLRSYDLSVDTDLSEKLPTLRQLDTTHVELLSEIEAAKQILDAMPGVGLAAAARAMVEDRDECARERDQEALAAKRIREAAERAVKADLRQQRAQHLSVEEHDAAYALRVALLTLAQELSVPPSRVAETVLMEAVDAERTARQQAESALAAAEEADARHETESEAMVAEVHDALWSDNHRGENVGQMARRVKRELYQLRHELEAQRETLLTERLAERANQLSHPETSASTLTAMGPWLTWLRALPSGDEVKVWNLAQSLLPQLITPEHTRYASARDGAAITTALRIAAGFLRVSGRIDGPLPEEMLASPDWCK